MDARAILEDKKGNRVFSAELAKVIGLNESIFLCQLHYWLTKKEDKQDCRTVFDGYVWVYNTFDEWQKQFPFWSKSTLKRTINNLRKNGYIICESHNRKGYDRTLWYRIDYEALEDIPAGQNEPMEVTGDNIPSGQNEPMGKGQNEPFHEVKLNPPIPNNTTDTTTKSKCIKGASSDAQRAENRFAGLEHDFSFRKWKREVYTAISQIDGYTLDKDDVLEVIWYFTETYKECMGEIHPHFTQSYMIKVAKKFQEEVFDVNGQYTDVPFDPELYRQLIDSYFNTEFYGCDYRLPHFLDGNIRAYRMLELYNQAV